MSGKTPLKPWNGKNAKPKISKKPCPNDSGMEGPSRKGRKGRQPKAERFVDLTDLEDPMEEPAPPPPANNPSPSGTAVVELVDVPGAEKAAYNRTVAKYKQYITEAQEMPVFSGKGMNEENREGMVRDVVRFCLFHFHKTPGHPLSRQTLLDRISAANKGNKKGKLGDCILKLVQGTLPSTLGLELAEVIRTPRVAAGKTPASEGTKFYVLRSILPPSLREQFITTPEEKGFRSLVLIVVSLIYLANGEIEEEDLWDLLAALGIERGFPHHALGNVDEAIKAMESMRYIIPSKIAKNDGDVKSYALAEMAFSEITKAEVDKFIDEMCKDPVREDDD